MSDEATVERVARAIFSEDGPHTHPWEMQHPYRANEFRTMARAAIAALPPQGDGWQDIASAPRDGTEVLLYHRAWGVLRGKWRDTGNEFGEQWTGTYMMPGLTAKDQPTHWRPLPEPPAPPAAERERRGK